MKKIKRRCILAIPLFFLFIILAHCISINTDSELAIALNNITLFDHKDRAVIEKTVYELEDFQQVREFIIKHQLFNYGGHHWDWDYDSREERFFNIDSPDIRVNDIDYIRFELYRTSLLFLDRNSTAYTLYFKQGKVDRVKVRPEHRRPILLMDF